MLSVQNLSKTYPGFHLDNVCFELPAGYIMGFIGRNGAGKTTTIKSLLGMVKPDSGTVRICGRDLGGDTELRRLVGYAAGGFSYYPHTRLKKIIAVYRGFYPNFDDTACLSYLTRFALDPEKKVSELSEGMKVKFALALALSHSAKILLLDEPTSGLDPISRDELLDIFREIIEDGEHSILFSTHITSDLDKCADYLLFIRAGRILLNAPKDDVIESHVRIAGKTADLDDDLKARMIAYKTHSLGFEGLIAKNALKESDRFERNRPNLEEIMVYYNKENASCKTF